MVGNILIGISNNIMKITWVWGCGSVHKVLVMHMGIQAQIPSSHQKKIRSLRLEE